MAAKSEAQALTERIRVDGAEAEATLAAADGVLRWRALAGGAEWCLVVESEVLGYESQGSMITVRTFAGARNAFACGMKSRRRVRRDFVFEMPTEECAVRWSDMLGDCIASLGRPKRLFIFVNPYGGKKCARDVFDDEIRPLLDAACILYTVQETKYQLHAQQVASSLELLKYDGIVCVSGDGILVEVVNGLLQREDWETAIKVPLGIIPAGTGNGMVKSLIESVGDIYSVSNATFAVIRGHKRSLDVATVSQADRKFFSVLMLTWGLVADIDIESEKYRWMGSARLDFYSLLRVVNLRKYHGRVRYVPAPGYEAYGETLKQKDSWKSDIVIPNKCQRDYANVQLLGYQGSGTQFEDSEWRSLDGPFILVWLNNVPWTSENVIAAPEAKFSDGYLDAVIIKDCPKSALVSALLKMNEGAHVKSPYVIYLKVKAFQLEPGQLVGNPSKGGIIDSDGEVIARGEGTYRCHQQEDLMTYGPPIQLIVEKGLATIFSPR